MDFCLKLKTMDEFLERDYTMIKEHNKLIEQHLLKNIQTLISSSSFFKIFIVFFLLAFIKCKY
jgi:hypothetical protein